MRDVLRTGVWNWWNSNDKKHKGEREMVKKVCFVSIPGLTKKNCVPQEDKDCKVIKSEVKGDVFTWVIECKEPEGTTIGSGRAVYRL